MAITKRTKANGSTSYEVAVYFKHPKTGKRGSAQVGTYARRRDADTAERRAKNAIADGSFFAEPERQAPTVEEAVLLWCSTRAMTVTANTMNGYRIAADNYVLPAWGTITVDELTYAHVQSQINAWVSEGKGAQVLHRALLVLRGALDMQLRSGNVSANAALGVVKPSVSQQKEVTIWTDDQLTRFLQEAERHDLAPLWHLLALEGMRRSEALALQWSDVQWDGDRAIVTIQRTLVPDLTNGGAALLQQRTKTKGSRRSVLLTLETSRLLKLHKDRQRFLREELAEMWSAGDAIVTTSIGTLVNPSQVKTSLRNLIERSNLEDPSQMSDGKTRKVDRQYLPDDQQIPQVSTHDLRHIAATKMLQGGAPLQVVQARLGHSDVRMTADRYGHLEVKDQRAAAEAMERAVSRQREA